MQENEGPIATQKTVRARITEEILAAVVAGAPKFEMPWHGIGLRGRPVNAASRIPYRGVNVLALWIAAEKRGYHTGTWATYRQWAALNAQVRKGETGSLIVFFREIERSARVEDTSEEVTENLLVARASWVFNADQVKGWECPPSAAHIDPVEVLAKADAFIDATGADIREGGEVACYLPESDYIEMPERERFTGAATSSPTEAYYATRLHELTHWTGHKTRLNRDLSGRFGVNAYAMEELVAELGAAFLCADLGITNSPRPDHAAYVGNWVRVLGSDPRAIFLASARAGAAVDYLTGLQPGPRAMTH